MSGLTSEVSSGSITIQSKFIVVVSKQFSYSILSLTFIISFSVFSVFNI